MPRGGDRGGRKPRTWQIKDSKAPEMMSIWVPRHLHERIKALAYMLDRGEIE